MRNLSNYYMRPKKLEPSVFFERPCKCKHCKKKFVMTLDNNSVESDGKISRKWKNEYETRNVLALGLIPVQRKFVRKAYELVIIYKSKCPNCGHKKTRFYTRYPERKIFHEEWERKKRVLICNIPFQNFV